MNGADESYHRPSPKIASVPKKSLFFQLLPDSLHLSALLLLLLFLLAPTPFPVGDYGILTLAPEVYNSSSQQALGVTTSSPSQPLEVASTSNVSYPTSVQDNSEQLLGLASSQLGLVPSPSLETNKMRRRREAKLGKGER